MGGPVNKAAYVFGTASIAAGNYNIMAAVMVGGMVPPKPTTHAGNTWSGSDAANGIAPSVIKESPMMKLVGPAFLSSAVNLIFVFLTVGNPLLYLVALAVGSAVGCALLGVLKKKTFTNNPAGLAWIPCSSLITYLNSFIVFLSGALSMAFNCTLMAPHGGIFVFLTVGNPLLYLVALAVGSLITYLNSFIVFLSS